METKKLLIKGIVQGVGMRFFIKRSAQALYLKGEVKNLNNGAVECIVQGKNSAIETLIDKIKHQSPGEVSSVETTIINAQPYSTFSVTV